MQAEINAAIKQVNTRGLCAASWQPEVVAVAAPLSTFEGIYVLNVSVSTDEPLAAAVRQISPPLMALVAQLQTELARLGEP